jgi:diguanylate cyclase (GGDEF)-like protein/PAS domain S-box-containing protein
VIQESPIGYAYHKTICDECGIPSDYEFIEVNTSFEIFTNLKASEIIGKRVTEVLPGIEKSEFDWIKIYGDIALNGGRKEFEQYSDVLGKWYKVSVYSPEKFYFITNFIDITDEKFQISVLKNMSSLSDEFLQFDNQEIDFQKICDEALYISGAKYSAFNLFNEDGNSFITKAISGDQGKIKKAAKFLGFKLIGKEWDYSPRQIKRFKDETITRYNSVISIVDDRIPKPIMGFLEKTFNVGEAVSLRIVKNNIMIGDFTLIMEKGKKFKQGYMMEIFAGYFGTVILRKRTEEALFREKTLTDAMFESIPGFVYVYDDKGKLVKWNKKHEVMTGYNNEELSQMTLQKWFKGEDLKRVLSGVDVAFKSGYGEVEADLVTKDGSKMSVRANGVGFMLNGKKYLTGVGIDVSDQKRYEQEIIKTKDYFKMMFNTNPDVAMITRLGDGVIVDVNEGFTSHSGYTREEVIGKSVSELNLYENDRDRQFMINKLNKKGFCKNLELVFRPKSGISTTGLISSRTIDIDGVTHIVSNVTDISKQKKIEKELERSNNRYKSIFDNSPIGITITDSITGKYLGFNFRYAEICGRKEKELLNTGWMEITHPDDIREDLNKMILLNEGKINGYNLDKRYLKKDSSTVWVNITVVPIQTETDNPCHLTMVMDITEKKEEEKRLRYLSYHDYLTGLYNRRYFEEHLSGVDSDRFLPLTVAMFDLNGLKLINDSFGHEVGDLHLQKLAKIVKDECTTGEIVARSGGDEFVIVMPNTNESDADIRINHLKSLILKEKVGSIALSVSFGYDTKTRKEENIKEILKNAEDNKYRKKINESSSMRSQTIQIIMNTLFEKSNREMLHSKRVSEICKDIAIAMHFENDEINQIKTAGLMHDIGKIGIDEKILNKPMSLDGFEWKEIQRHPEIGWRILKSANEFSRLADFIILHHERLDGKGYPKGLKGDDIPIEAKIIAVADAYDAITTERPYRSKKNKEEAIAEMRRHSGTQFDPYVLEIFINNLIETDY